MVITDEMRQAAVSFPGTAPGEKSVYLGSEETKLGIYHYWKGESGKMYYASASGLRFAREMEKIIHKNAVLRHRLKK